MKEEFKKELEVLINRHSIENEWDMPDYMMAEVICSFILGMGDSIKKRDKWMGYGKKEVTEEAPDMKHELPSIPTMPGTSFHLAGFR